MNIEQLLILVLALGVIWGGILLLKQSAKKFNLTDEQKKKVKERQAAWEKEEKEEDKE
ncbi:DUF2897 family protein [Thalassotalea euphylliae]|uniref:DUF2897 family protein n=1 Tax=Thalassotalea euphylliae TaxID=1655234 RepID=A0A3E0U0B8_9GAMM|nr:DUF2897 family protein [Thalassotalea euphylliae]REL30130.1 DUF2897 family protein [Thalassotalea euphylliae]